MRGTLREVLPSVDTTRAGVVGVGVVFIRASRASAPILQPVIQSSGGGSPTLLDMAKPKASAFWRPLLHLLVKIWSKSKSLYLLFVFIEVKHSLLLTQSTVWLVWSV